MKTIFLSAPIFIFDCEENQYENIDQEICQCYSKINFLNGSNLDSINTQTSGPIHTSQLIRDYDLKNLKNYISNSLKKVNEYIHGYDRYNYTFINSWMTRTTKSKLIQTHHHETIGISGVYYHRVDEKCGNIYFRSFDKCFDISPLFKRTQDYEVDVRSGRLLLFPSWFEHGTRSSNSDNERISIAFNMVPEKKQ
jgi:uncharacterized protein (TIGR02466 family)